MSDPVVIDPREALEQMIPPELLAKAGDDAPPASEDDNGKKMDAEYMKKHMQEFWSTDAGKKYMKEKGMIKAEEPPVEPAPADPNLQGVQHSASELAAEIAKAQAELTGDQDAGDNAQQAVAAIFAAFSNMAKAATEISESVTAMNAQLTGRLESIEKAQVDMRRILEMSGALIMKSADKIDEFGSNTILPQRSAESAGAVKSEPQTQNQYEERLAKARDDFVQHYGTPGAAQEGLLGILEKAAHKNDEVAYTLHSDIALCRGPHEWLQKAKNPERRDLEKYLSVTQ